MNRDGHDALEGGRKEVGLVARPAQPGAMQAPGDAMAARALLDLVRPKGGSLVVFAGTRGYSCWPHLPEPVVVVSSIEEAYSHWPTREFQAVLVHWDIPDAGVEGLALLAKGQASFLRIWQDPVEGVPWDSEGDYRWDGDRGARIDIRPDASIWVYLGNGLRGSMYFERAPSFRDHVSHLCYLERQRILKAAQARVQAG